MDDSNEPACNHTKITRHKDTRTDDFANAWVCIGCGMEFTPITAADDYIAHMESEHQRVLDTVTGVFSAVLWDLNERNKATGNDQPDIDLNALTERLCEDEGHNRGDDGVCNRCGDSPFLGT